MNENGHMALLANAIATYALSAIQYSLYIIEKNKYKVVYAAF